MNKNCILKISCATLTIKYSYLENSHQELNQKELQKNVIIKSMKNKEHARDIKL